MKYINNSAELNHEFGRLLEEYANYYWIVAWAGLPGEHFEILSDNLHKIRQVVVGLHFYQTAPEFIEAFNPVEAVRFVKKVSGVFHPKVYLFVNDESHWEVLIGSANFTDAAFNRNNEACLLVDSGEAQADMLGRLLGSIDLSWRLGTKFTEPELLDYSRMAARARERRRQDEADAGQGGEGSEAAIQVRTMTWPVYIERIFGAGQEAIRERLRLLDIVRGYFAQYETFATMPPLVRKQIGGYIWAGQPVNFKIFGNMQNARRFKHIVNEDPTGVSVALDQIPAEGPVGEPQYLAFVDGFEEALEGGNKYRSGTRLLAMKRPDIFFALSEGNNARLAEDFGIEGVGGMNFTRYWHEVIVPMQESRWWRDPTPVSEVEQRIVPYRAAFMDAMYYQPV